MLAKLIRLNTHGDDRGDLTVIEKVVPYDIKRIFYIYNVPEGKERASHANRILKETLVPLVGSCKVSLHDGTTESVFSLTRPDECLLIPNMNWIRIYDFSRDCVLLVIASEYYDPDDHIETFEEFRKLVGK